MILKIYLDDDVYERLINDKDIYGDDQAAMYAIIDGEVLNEEEDEA